jgi:hypothetical protein
MSHWKNLPTLFTRTYFAAKARVMRVFLGDIPMDAKPKVFSTGGLGWHVQAKKQVAVGDARVWCQINIQVTVIGSRALPPGSVPAEGVADAAA